MLLEYLENVEKLIVNSDRNGGKYGIGRQLSIYVFHDSGVILNYH